MTVNLSVFNYPIYSFKKNLSSYFTTQQKILVVAAIALSCLAASYLFFRDYFSKKHQIAPIVQKQNIAENDAPKELIKPKPVKLDLPEQQEDFISQLQSQQALVTDARLSQELSGWRVHGKKIGEQNQTLEQYIHIKKAKGEAWPNRHSLYIQRLGNFSAIDLKIIAITADYLSIFHRIPVHELEETLTMDQLKERYLQGYDNKSYQVPLGYHQFLSGQFKKTFPREDQRYLGEVVLELMRIVILPTLQKPSDLLAFTDQDLFTFQLQNFVFGCASSNIGIWSNARFGNPKESPAAFQSCLLRMMKIAAHEFGHMRGLPHCTDYVCNMGGYMNLPELDERPLLYCMQDMAKICYLTHTDLSEHHQALLNFFKNFNQTYELNCDFTKEIDTLTNRLKQIVA